MKVKIEIDCNNAAFDDNPEYELCRILRELTDNMAETRIQDITTLRDVNGNKVGTVEIWDAV